MATHNEHTGDSLTTKVATDKYRSGWDAIFGKKAKGEPVKEAPKSEPEK